MKTIYFYLAIATYLIACPVRLVNLAAAEKEQADGVNQVSESLTPVESSHVQCYQSPGYLVVAKSVKGRVGTDFLVKYKSRADEELPCSYILQNNDFEIKNEWAEYFAGLTKDLLILDSTTGPGPSGLIIWDLKKRRKVYEGSWASPTEIKDDSITYWAESGEAADDNCPERAEWELHGLGAAMETKVRLNLSDFTVSKTKETRCSPRQ
ncbi:MAG: hypothetical protein ACMUIA_00825 [bacterium]